MDIRDKKLVNSFKIALKPLSSQTNCLNTELLFSCLLSISHLWKGLNTLVIAHYKSPPVYYIFLIITVLFWLQENEEDILRRMHMTSGSRLNAPSLPSGRSASGMGPVSQISTQTLGMLGNTGPLSNDFSMQLLHELGIDPANITNQVFVANVRNFTYLFCSSPVSLCHPHPLYAQEHCRISPPRFLAECRKRRLNQTSFVFAVFCVVCFFWVVFSFCSVSVFNLSSVLYFPAWINVNTTV